MTDCKILRLPLVNEASYTMNGGTMGGQYPEAEAEINKYLRLGYEVKGIYMNAGLIVVLEKKD